MTMLSQFRIPALCVIGALSLLVLAMLGLPEQRVASAQASAGTIAYVQADTRDEIRLIDPNGSNDRQLWTHGQPDPNELYEVWSLDWRPDGTELAFASTHENWCSIHSSDIFAVGAHGTGYRRITQAPACDDLSSYPQGIVEVPVRAPAGFDGFIYFQGAPSAQRVTLPPGGTGVVTFSSVADLGHGVLQLAAMIVGGDRDPNTATAVDVQAGATVRTETMSLYSPVSGWDAKSPTWRSDGSRIGYVWDTNVLHYLPPNPAPLDVGDDLLATNWSDPPSFIRFTWGPPARANELLYAAEVWNFDEGTTEGIYLVTEGSTTGGQRLLTMAPWESVLGLAWLPDGTGFVYSVLETDENYEQSRANLFIYTFATSTATRLTEFDDAFAGMLDVSPDGQQIVFERGTAVRNLYYLFVEVVDPDLWMIDRDGSDLHLLVANGRAPAWSSQAPPPPPPPPPPPGNYRIYLPLAVRGS